MDSPIERVTQGETYASSREFIRIWDARKVFDSSIPRAVPRMSARMYHVLPADSPGNVLGFNQELYGMPRNVRIVGRQSGHI